MNKNQKITNLLHRLSTQLMALTLAIILCVTQISSANARGLIRDTEIENLIRIYSQPIFKAAGLSSQNIQIHLVNSRQFNAFVVDGRNMFINTGSIMISKTPNQLIGVIAHEAGHIAGGHMARLRAHLKKTRSIQTMLSILTAAASVAGAATGNSDLARGGQAASAGTSGYLYRSMAAYQRNEEAAADQAALLYLKRTHQSAKGMISTFEYFSNQMLGAYNNIDPYLLTHPLPRERIEQLKSLAHRSPYFNKVDPPKLQLAHDMARAKLYGFLNHPNSVMRRYPKSDQSLPALYARAIAAKKLGGVRAFLPKIDQLIAKKPNNPYFYELKGQFLCEAGQAKSALTPLQKSLQLRPGAPLVEIMLAQCLLQTNQKAYNGRAITLLRKALIKEPRSSTGYRQMAIAHSRRGDIANASLSSAQAYFYEGQLKLAKVQAKRAKGKFKHGSPGWIKADDILKYKRKKN